MQRKTSIKKCFRLFSKNFVNDWMYSHFLTMPHSNFSISCVRFQIRKQIICCWVTIHRPHKFLLNSCCEIYKVLKHTRWGVVLPIRAFVLPHPHCHHHCVLRTLGKAEHYNPVIINLTSFIKPMSDDFNAIHNKILFCPATLKPCFWEF